MRSKRKRLVAQLDALFSLYIRMRDKKKIGHCPFCCKPAEQCFHFVTRAKHSLRWDVRNAVASCAGCNLRYEFDPHFAIQWYIRTYGQDAYDNLIYDGNIIPKHSIDELQDMVKVYKAGIENFNLKRSLPSFGPVAYIDE